MFLPSGCHRVLLKDKKTFPVSCFTFFLQTSISWRPCLRRLYSIYTIQCFGFYILQILSTELIHSNDIFFSIDQILIDLIHNYYLLSILHKFLIVMKNSLQCQQEVQTIVSLMAHSILFIITAGKTFINYRLCFFHLERFRK